MNEREREVQSEPQGEGRKGGAAEAYTGAYPAAVAFEVPLGRVRWGAVLAGLAVAIATTLLISSLGRAIGLRAATPGGAGGLAYWMIGSTVIGLFIGSMLASRLGRVIGLWTDVLHGLVLWSLLMIWDVLSRSLLSGLPTGLVPAAGGPVTTSASMMTTASPWWFFIGYVILLIAAVLGGIAGIASDETAEAHHEHG